MMNELFCARDVKIGLICAAVFLPIAWVIAASASETEFWRVIFFGSKYFAFKATLGATEIVVFGLTSCASKLYARKPPRWQGVFGRN
jgi:hypothetical protein